MWFGMSYCLDTWVSGGHSLRSDPTRLQTKQEKFREIFKSSSDPKGNVVFDQGSFPGPWEQGSLTGWEDLAAGLQGGFCSADERTPAREGAGLVQEGSFS